MCKRLHLSPCDVCMRENLQSNTYEGQHLAVASYLTDPAGSWCLGIGELLPQILSNVRNCLRHHPGGGKADHITVWLLGFRMWSVTFSSPIDLPPKSCTFLPNTCSWYGGVEMTVEPKFFSPLSNSHTWFYHKLRRMKLVAFIWVKCVLTILIGEWKKLGQ